MPTIDIVLNAVSGNVNATMSGVANSLGKVQNQLANTSKASVDASKALEDAMGKAKLAADQLDKSIKTTGVSVNDLRSRMQSTGMTLKDTIKSFNLSGNAAEQAANAYRKAGRDGAESARDIAQAQRQVQRELQKTEQGLQKLDQGLHMARNAGLGMMGVGAAFEFAAVKGLQQAATMETQIKTLEALTGSASRAKAIYKEVDEMSVRSIAELPDLVSAAKNLQAAQIYSKRNLTAVDDLSAVGRDRGVKPMEVAFALSRLQNGDFGEGFQRMRELGINRKELEGEGLKFSGSNQFQGTAEQAVEGVVKAIEKKFGGLSAKLGAETTEGALSNLRDAFGRVTRSIFGELIPAATLGARFLTGLAGFFNELPSPIRKIIAFGTVLIGGLFILGGGLIALAATAGIGVLALSALGITVTAAGVTAGGATIGFGGLAVALGGVLLTVGVVALGIVAAIAITVAAVYGLYKAAQWLAGKIDEKFGKGTGEKVTSVGGATIGGAIGGVIPGGQIIGNKLGGWLGSKAGGGDAASPKGSDAKGDTPGTLSDAKSEILGVMSDAKKQMESFKNGDYKTGVSGLPDAMIGASGMGASQAEIEALEDKIAASEDKDERKQLREQLRLARRGAKHEKVDERETKQAETLASRENATALTEAAKVQAAARKQATQDEIEKLSSTRKAERRADEDAHERMNRQYELSHAKARGLDMDHMKGIVELQRHGFSLAQIGAARDVYSTLKKINGGKGQSEEERLRDGWAKEDRDRAFRRSQEDKDDALRAREDDLRDESNADATGIVAAAKGRGAWGKGANITRMQADAAATIGRIKASRDGEDGDIEYSNAGRAGASNRTVTIPKPQIRRNTDGTLTILHEPYKLPLSRGERDDRAY